MPITLDVYYQEQIILVSLKKYLSSISNIGILIDMKYRDNELLQIEHTEHIPSAAIVTFLYNIKTFSVLESCYCLCSVCSI
jgi:hypothetical protein